MALFSGVKQLLIGIVETIKEHTVKIIGPILSLS